MNLSALSLAMTRPGYAFSPASLFSAGEQGAWYDPSDLTTLFQDSAGTTPVTAVEQPVGLMLDKSKGLVLGPELVTNGDFSFGTTGWTLTGGTATVTASGGGMEVSSTVTAYVAQSFTTVVGRSYRYSVQIVSQNGAAFNGIRKADNNTASSNIVDLRLGLTSGAGISTGVFVATATTTFIVVQANSSAVITVDNISIRELPGNHAIQSTSTSRPVLSARVNLLTRTEDIGQAVWTKQAGVTTSSSILFTSTNANVGVFQQISALPVANYRMTVEVRRVDVDQITLGLVNLVDAIVYNFATDTIGGLASGTATRTFLPDGWVRISYTRDVTPSGNYGPIIKVNTAGSLELRNIDLRVTNTGTNLPVYQRVNTATDYDTAGFPLYLACDGVDDGMVTNSINFTGTDKITVVAGVRKLSDINGTIAELSAITNTNPGSFMVRASLSNDASYFLRFNGTSQADIYVSGYAAPITNVLSATADISGDSAILRINGTQAASSTADQGTGNYGNYPLYLFRRGGTTVPFNGRFYGLVVRGAATPTPTLQSAENWMNQRTRAY